VVAGALRHAGASACVRLEHGAAWRHIAVIGATGRSLYAELHAAACRHAAAGQLNRKRWAGTAADAAIVPWRDDHALFRMWNR